MSNESEVKEVATTPRPSVGYSSPLHIVRGFADTAVEW